MKRPIPLPITAAVLGAAAFVLRLCLYRFGTDEKGLLVSGHPLEIALWLLAAAAAAFVVLQSQKRKARQPYSVCFPASNRSVIGCFAFAAGILLTVMANRYTYSTLEFVRNIVGLLAVPALTAVAICRRLGKRPLFGFHAVICLALALHTVSYYRIWCACPQLQDAFFPMMGCILLMLFAYYQTAFDVNMKKPEMQTGTGLLAAFCCFAAMAESDTALLYLTGGIWTLTNLCAPAAENKEECQ